jgi:probable phosphoglycerate mutase
MAGPLIYYVRHGQTDWNAEERYQGRIDIPLNDTGRGQAKGNGEKLAKILGQAEGFEFISSPLVRSRETMEIIRREMGLEPSQYAIEPRLIEISYGDFEGTTRVDLKANNREAFDQRKKDMWNFQPENGESHAMVVSRVGEWLESLPQDGKFLVAAHGAIGRVMRHLAGGAAIEDIAHFAFPQDQFYRFEGGAEELI